MVWTAATQTDAREFRTALHAPRRAWQNSLTQIFFAEQPIKADK